MAKKTPTPALEFEMLVEMKKYMTEMLKEHTKESNALILIKRQFKQVGRISESEATQKRIDQLKRLENAARNFISFIKDYLERLKK
jgi:hypothetical protein